jgi:hypothetical protein
MDDVVPWPKSGRAAEPPKPIRRPCDYALLSAYRQLETQLGTIEAYNRLAAFAANVRAQIDRGEVKAQNPLYATSLGFAKD